MRFAQFIIWGMHSLCREFIIKEELQGVGAWAKKPEIAPFAYSHHRASNCVHLQQGLCDLEGHVHCAVIAWQSEVTNSARECEIMVPEVASIPQQVFSTLLIIPNIQATTNFLHYSEGSVLLASTVTCSLVAIISLQNEGVFIMREGGKIEFPVPMWPFIMRANT